MKTDQTRLLQCLLQIFGQKSISADSDQTPQFSAHPVVSDASTDTEMDCFAGADPEGFPKEFDLITLPYLVY